MTQQDGQLYPIDHSLLLKAELKGDGAIVHLVALNKSKYIHLVHWYNNKKVKTEKDLSLVQDTEKTLRKLLSNV